MGRNNPAGVPFLVKRTDSTRYIYFREIPKTLRPHLSGEVICAWNDNRRAIGGGSAIKLSLETGDLATAKSRWSGLHAQMDRLFESADKRSRQQARSDTAVTQISCLTPTQIKALGEQYFHDLLAADDALTLDRQAREDTVKLGLVASGVLEQPTVSQIRREEIAIHGNEAIFARRMLSEEAYSEFDRTAHFSTSGVWMDGDPTPEGGEYLFSEPSEVEQRLAVNGLSLPVGHPDRLALSREILRQKARANDALVDRRNISKDPVATPPRPVVAVSNEADLEGDSLRKAYDRWIKVKKPSAGTAAEYKVYVERFIDICGDHGIRAITRPVVIVYRDAMEDYPRKVPGGKVPLGTLALIDWARSHPEVQRLSRSTIDDKAIGAISAILAVPLKEGKLDFNPCSGVKFGPDDDEVEERPPYTVEDLNILFSSPVYAQGKRPKSGGGEAAYWIPLISLFGGQRLEEVGQLRIDDVKTYQGEIGLIRRLCTLQTNRESV